MNVRQSALAASLCLGLVATPALAGSLEGRIQSVSPNNRSFVVKGQTIYTDGATDYDDGLQGFADLKPGLMVKVDPTNRGGRSFAKEVELED